MYPASFFYTEGAEVGWNKDKETNKLQSKDGKEEENEEKRQETKNKNEKNKNNTKAKRQQERKLNDDLHETKWDFVKKKNSQ